MRGELLNVWEDTYREIWTPLAEEEGVPTDLFSQLYRELSPALKEPLGEGAQVIPLSDAIQLREAFDRALSMSGVEIALATAEFAFGASGATSHEDLQQRRSAAEECLAALIGDADSAKRLLAQTLSDLADDPKRRAEAKARARDAIVNDASKSRQTFEQVRSSALVGEIALVGFFESAFEILDDVGGDALSNRYFNLLSGFIDKFSLRYDLRRPCVLCPTLPGLFASLVRHLSALASQDAHLDQLMKEYEDAVRDLRFGCTDGRIKTCIGKQFMLLEAIGAFDPSVTNDTLGGMCEQLNSWPHATIKQALKKIYGFASDYPGIRHGSRAKGALRAIEMRDMVAMSILLTGFTLYLERRLSADAIYGGSTMNATRAPAMLPLPIPDSGNSGGNSQERGFFGRLMDRVLGGKV